MHLCLEEGDLMAAKIIRNIAAHSGPTQELFLVSEQSKKGNIMTCAEEE